MEIFMFNVGLFLESLPLMLYGMGGIFIVIGVIILCVMLLCKLFPEKEDK